MTTFNEQIKIESAAEQNEFLSEVQELDLDDLSTVNGGVAFKLIIIIK